MEDNLRQSLIISKGDFSIFFQRPISVVILAVMVATVFLPYLIQFLKRRHFRPAAQTRESKPA
jgi:putative tricarboxylic transport membrane protein